eukprot:2866311-Prorocentrum_lima.AAC.1
MPEVEYEDPLAPLRPIAKKERSRSSERGKKPPRQPLPAPQPPPRSAALEPDDMDFYDEYMPSREPTPDAPPQQGSRS